MSNYNYVYYSVSKFVHTMDEFAKEKKLQIKLDKNESISFCHIWFRGNECYEGKFDDIQIKNPIYMRITTTHRKDLFLNQEQILKLFEYKPVLCIRQNMFRNVPRGQERKYLHLVFIDFVEHETPDGIRYYPVDIYIERCNNRIKTIEKQFKKENVNEESDSNSDTV